MPLLSFVRSGRRESIRGAQAVKAAASASVEQLESRRLFALPTAPIGVSLDPTNTAYGNNASSTTATHYGPKVSTNGRYVAFDSTATNLVSGTTTAGTQVFMRDTTSNTTRLVSVNNAGGGTAGSSYFMDMSNDGRYVLFVTGGHLYRRDMIANSTTQIDLERGNLLSANSDVGRSGVPTAGGVPTFQALISDDGNYVSYMSSDPFMVPNLIDNDTVNRQGVIIDIRDDDLFLRDIRAQRNYLIDQGPTANRVPGTTGTIYSMSMSASGTEIVFDTDRSNVGGATQQGGTNGALRQVYISYPLSSLPLSGSASKTVNLSVGAADASGVAAGQVTGTSMNPVISADGQWVTFISDSGNLTGDASTTGTGPQQVILESVQQNTPAYAFAEGNVSEAFTFGESNGDALGTPAITPDGSYVFYWSNATDIIANRVTGVNLYRYNLATGANEIVTLNGQGQTTFDPKISVSDNGEFVAWGVDGTNLDPAITNYGAAGQINTYVRDMAAPYARLLNVSSVVGVASDHSAIDPMINGDGNYVIFVSAATNLLMDPSTPETNAADTNGKADVFECVVPVFDVGQANLLVNAADVTVGGDSGYYFTVTYNSVLPVNVSMLDSQDITVYSVANGYSTQAKYIGDNSTHINKNIVTATYMIVPPGGAFDLTDNSVYTIEFNGGQVADTQGSPFVGQILGTFAVSINLASDGGNSQALSVSEGQAISIPVSPKAQTDPTATLPLTVNYSIIPGTATPGQDYTDISGTLSFPTGASTDVATITIQTLQDLIAEGPETFTVILSGATPGTNFAFQRYVVTILDDDTQQGGSVGINNGGGGVGGTGSSGNAQTGGVVQLGSNGSTVVTVSETAGTAIIPVSRSTTGSNSLLVAGQFLYTVYSALGDTAVPNVNYTPVASGIVSFNAGSTTPVGGAILVPILHDFTVTGNLTFTVVLTNATNGIVVAGTAARVVIQDDDSQVQFASSTLQATDSSGVISLPITRTGNLTPASAVHITFTGAILGTDYVVVDDGGVDVNGDVNFAAGVSTRTVHVQLIKHDGSAAIPNLVATLSNPRAYDPNGIVSLTYATVPGVVTAETVGIANVDLEAPHVTNFDLTVKSNHVVAMTLMFNRTLVGGVTSLTNYTLFSRTRDGKLGKIIKLKSATYNASTRTVTVVPTAALGLNQLFQLNVNAKGSITDTSGNKIDGNGDGIGGDSFGRVFGYGTALTYAESDGDLVTLSMKGKGSVELIETLTGSVDVSVLSPINNVSVLNGNVVRGKHGNGIGQLNTVRLNGAVNGLRTEGDRVQFSVVTIIPDAQGIKHA